MTENIHPGQYRMRDGNTAVVRYSDHTLSHSYYWVGSIGDTTDVWDRNGRYYVGGQDSPWDLVARIPDEPQPPQPPADDRIERAVTLLKGSTQYYTKSFGYIVKEDIVNAVVRILEGKEE